MKDLHESNQCSFSGVGGMLTLTSDGVLYGVGWDLAFPYGVDYDPAAAMAAPPVRIAERVVSAAAGYNYGLYVTADGALVVGLVIIAAVALIAFTLKRVIDMPLLPLKQAASLLQSGKKDMVHLTTESRCREVQQLFSASNALLSDIQTLEERIYEEKLAQSRLELQFLKSQITPHFLVNCLNAFSYLAASSEKEDRAAAQRLTQTLSQHIRYSFVSAEMIPLSQEFDHLENYLELACIRYPGSLAYDLSLPKECRAAQIPPMRLLTLCENSVKHNLIMGEWLKIRVSAERTEWKGNPAIHICYLDNGIGYPPEMLEHCNHILEHPEDVRDGQSHRHLQHRQSHQPAVSGKSRFSVLQRTRRRGVGGPVYSVELFRRNGLKEDFRQS